MKYIMTTGWEDGTADLTKRLIDELTHGKHVTWLLSGGSNIITSVQVMEKVTASLSKNLTIGLIDERYGAVGHPDSNWKQLISSGFRPKQATVLPVLQDNFDLEETATDYSQLLKEAFSAGDLVLAQIGIGTDGHVAGILPGSDAAVENNRLAVGYSSSGYQRITATAQAFTLLNIAYVFAFGESKRQALMTLKSDSLSPTEQPAQLLKIIPEAYIYSDQIGDS